MPPRNKSTKARNPLGEFLSNIAHEKHLSLRAIAAGSGISHAYLSEIFSGKKTPSVGVCNALADSLELSRTKIYKLAGWFDFDEDQEFCIAVQELANKYPDLKAFLEEIRNISDREEMNRLMRILRAALPL